MDDLKWCIDYLSSINKKGLSSEYTFERFRALMNITMPINLSDEYYTRQDRVLADYFSDKKFYDVSESGGDISILQADITLLNADGIVNACNSKMLGCFVPCHNCIDNAIHSFAGLQVRRDLMNIMKVQGCDEPCGKCKVTYGYNFHSKYIFHTVGPIYRADKQNEIDLRNCYTSCLEKACQMNLKSLVFCSLSTGLYGYPIEKASKIAVDAVSSYLEGCEGKIKVVFGNFHPGDMMIF